MRIYLRKQVKKPAVDTRALKRFVRDLLRGEGVREGGITVVLTDDAEVRRLNARFRGKDRSTDVLAFPLGEEDEQGTGPYIGDVVISMERAAEQAPRFGNELESELARLVSHGVLHLLGYDHHTPWDGRRMKAAERRALSRFEARTLIPDGGSETA